MLPSCAGSTTTCTPAGQPRPLALPTEQLMALCSVFEALLLPRPCLPELLKCVRLSLLDRGYLVMEVGAEPLVRSSETCRDLVDEAKDFLLLPERRSSMAGRLGKGSLRPQTPSLCVQLLRVMTFPPVSRTWKEGRGRG